MKSELFKRILEEGTSAVLLALYGGHLEVDMIGSLELARGLI